MFADSESAFAFLERDAEAGLLMSIKLKADVSEALARGRTLLRVCNKTDHTCGIQENVHGLLCDFARRSVDKKIVHKSPHLDT
jgi:hypothetical protein